MGNIKNLDEDKVFSLVFPQNVVSTVFEPVDYEYIHSELKKTGVNLKLLWNEYRNQCNSKTLFLADIRNSAKGIQTLFKLNM